MKKKLTAIILTILMLTTTAGIFTACKDDNNPSTGLTAEQQVQIAKDTFNGIYEAETNKIANAAIRSMASATQIDEFESLFDKYEYQIRDHLVAELQAIYHIIAQPAENLLIKQQLETISNSYTVEYNFINENYTAPLPATINFHGVVQEDGYNKIYTTSDLSHNAGRIVLISYYNSPSDYGYEVMRYYPELMEGTDLPEHHLEYYKFDKKENISICAEVDGVIYKLGSKEKFCRLALEEDNDAGIIEQEDAIFLKSIIQNFFDSFIETSTTIEKSNNNNMLKTMSLETITLDFDANRYYSAIGQ